MSSAVEELGGTEVVRRPADEVNAELASQGYTHPPFEAGTTVYEFWTTTRLVLVRAFGDEDRVEGRWLMRPEDIEGLTPLQIKSRFGLDSVPVWVIDAVIPPGSRMRVGIAGHQYEWDALDGGIQVDVLDKGIAIWGEPRLLVGP